MHIFLWETGGILFREYCFGGENSLSSAANSVSSARNSVSSLWHINNSLGGTHWVRSPELSEPRKTHWEFGVWNRTLRNCIRPVSDSCMGRYPLTCCGNATHLWAVKIISNNFPYVANMHLLHLLLWEKNGHACILLVHDGNELGRVGGSFVTRHSTYRPPNPRTFTDTKKWLKSYFRASGQSDSKVT